MKKRISRRRFLAASAAASTATLAAPFVRGAYAAGKLTVAFWDHWVPGGNQSMTELCEAWAAAEKVDLKIDFISTQGNKLALTIAAEALAKSGHDIMDFSTWEPFRYASTLEPVDDLVKEISARNGDIVPAMAYLAKSSGHWSAVPSTRGTLVLPPCSRIDLLKKHAGIDVVAMYPATAPATKAAAEWTWDNFLVAAEKCHKAGVAFGLPLGSTADATDWTGALFASFGAELVNAKGDITVKSDPVRQVLDYAKRLVAFLPEDVASWDNASNNKWLVSGRGALIFNPPSAWVVAKRDAPQIAEQLWTHAMPKGPKGRCVSTLPRFQGVWSFSKNKSAAKSLILHLSSRTSVEKLVEGGQGYDLPPFPRFNDIKTWDEQGPPKGTLSHYPARGDEKVIVPCAPSPPEIAQQIYINALMPKMIVRVSRGENMETTMNWVVSEIEGYARR